MTATSRRIRTASRLPLHAGKGELSAKLTEGIKRYRFPMTATSRRIRTALWPPKQCRDCAVHFHRIPKALGPLAGEAFQASRSVAASTAVRYTVPIPIQEVTVAPRKRCEEHLPYMTKGTANWRCPVRLSKNRPSSRTGAHTGVAIPLRPGKCTAS